MTPAVSHPIPTDTCKNDPDLAAVIETWGRLPEAIRAGILAMVKAATDSPYAGKLGPETELLR